MEKAIFYLLSLNLRIGRSQLHFFLKGIHIYDLAVYIIVVSNKEPGQNWNMLQRNTIEIL